MGAAGVSRLTRSDGFVAATSLLVFTAAIACSSTNNTAPAEAHAPLASWFNNELPVHTRLSATKDSIVYGGVEENRFYVVALDPATGKQRWRRLSDVGGRSPLSEQKIFTDDGTAYVLGAPRLTQTDLVAVTTATGSERWRTVLIAQSVDPDVMSCGEMICVVVTQCDCHTNDHARPRKEIWKLSRADGTIVETHSIAPNVGTGDAILGIDPPNSATASVLTATHGTTYVSRFERLGEAMAWSKPAAELFGSTSVGPNGGFRSGRVPDGWIAWLGPSITKAELTPGDEFPSGAVAAFDDRGTPRWVARDRHLCVFFDDEGAAALCDGTWRMVDAADSEIRPEIIEGRAPATGAVTWEIDVHGEIDETDPGIRVLRVGQCRYWIDLSTGPVLLDLGTGPVPDVEAPESGWCNAGAISEKINSTQSRPFRRANNRFPCRLGGEHVEPSLPIPDFAGVNAAGWSAWVQDGAVHARRIPPR